MSVVDVFERACESLPSARQTTGDERAQERLALFDALGPEFQQRFWRSLGDEVAWAQEQLRLDRGDVSVRRPKVGKRWARQATRPPAHGFVDRASNRTTGGSSRNDPLHEISPLDYFPILTGTIVPPNGVVRCPIHDDRTPSLKVYSDHWHCFGCGKGGDIYALAAALWGRELRGEDFKTLRRELARQILQEAA